jgi:predicted nucleic acid-binding protein
MITAIDTTVVIDVVSSDPVYGEASEAALVAAASQGDIIYGEIVYAELTANFPNTSELILLLRQLGAEFLPSSPAALDRAGSAWAVYSRTRRPGFDCSVCGRRQQPSCVSCGALLSSRQHMIADFLIGGHALYHADKLLTRDRGYFRRYFPDLRVDSP